MRSLWLVILTDICRNNLNVFLNKVSFARNFFSSTSSSLSFTASSSSTTSSSYFFSTNSSSSFSFPQFAFISLALNIPNMPLINCLIYYFFHFSFFISGKLDKRERERKMHFRWFIFTHFDLCFLIPKKLFERPREKEEEANRSAPHKFAFAMHNFLTRNTNVK